MGVHFAFLKQSDSVSYFLLIYQLIQWFLDKLLSPAAPAPGAHLGRPKIAIIGAGLPGVAAASHCVGHGFDVRIFEKGDRKALGGIWSRVNNTSASKSTASCTGSTPPSGGQAATPTNNKSSPR